MSDGSFPAVVKFGTVERARGALGVAPNLGIITLGPDGASARLGAGTPIRVAGVKKSSKTPDSAPTNPLVIEAGETVIIPVPPLDYAARRYKFLVSPNPELFAHGAVSSPGLVPRLELAGACLGFTAARRVDLEMFAWIFDITAID